MKNTRLKEDGQDADEDVRLAKFYRNPELEYIDEPATVVDTHGHIAVWYLPDILDPKHQVKIVFDKLFVTVY